MRQGDIWTLALGFGAVLAALCLFGALGWQAGFVAWLVGAGLMLVYANLREPDPRPEPRAELQPPVSDPANAKQDAQRAVVLALSQPALIVKGNQIAAFNEAAGRLFNLARGTSPPLASLRHPLLLSGVEAVRAGSETYECEIVPARHPGQNWSAYLTGLADGREPADILIVLTDLAPVRRAERARADFLANASHELRTPLTSISGFVETMQGAAKDDQDAWPRFLDIIAEQASHMRGLISDIMSLSRIELGAHELLNTEIDLRQSLSESIEAMSHAATAQGASIELEFPQVPDGVDDAFRMIGSEGEVKQVIQNLLGNAIKYSPEGGKVTVTAGRLTQAEAHLLARSWAGANRATLFSAAEVSEHGAIWFSVRDQGVGIAPEFLPRLGERFFRVDDSRGGPVEGTGLGLAIVKHIMAHHQGGLVVESVEGEGALFTVWFKAAPPVN